MTGVTTDYGINDPNLLAILGGIDDPHKMAQLLEANNGMGGVLVPGMRRRQDATVQNVLQMIASNSLARASLHERQQDITRAKDQETYFANMANHMPGMVKEGVNPSDYLPYRRLIAPGSVGGSGSIGVATLLAQQGKQAWNNSEIAKAYDQLDTAGYTPGDGATIDPNNPNMPRMTKGPARSILEQMVKNQNGKIDVQFDALGNRIGMSGKFNVGGPIPKNINDVAPIGTPEQGFSTPPAVINDLRSIPQLKNAQIATLPNRKGYTATYKSNGKDVVVYFPADAQGNAIKSEGKIIGSGTPTP